MNIYELMESVGRNNFSLVSESNLFNGIIEAFDSNLENVNFDKLTEINESTTDLSDEQIKEFCNLTDALTGIYEDISVELEASSDDPSALDVASKLGKTKKEFKSCVKAAKKNIKARNYKEAKKNIKDAKSALNDFEKTINSFDKNDIKENIIGSFISSVVYLINNLVWLLVPFVPVVGKFALLVKTLRDAVGRLKPLIKDIKNEGLTPSIINGTLHTCETEIRRMIRALDDMEKNVEKLAGSVKESTYMDDSFDLNNSDIFGFPAM